MEISSPDGVVTDIVAAVRRAIQDLESGVLDKFTCANPDYESTPQNAPIFLLCQHFLSVPGIKDVPADDLYPYVAMYWDVASDHDRFGQNEDAAIASFLDLWERGSVKHARGPLFDIALRYAEMGYKTPEEIYRYPTETMRRLVHVCYLLALLQNDGGKFFLSVEDAGRIMEGDRNTGSVCLKRLCHEKVLGLVKKGSRTSGLASVYVYFSLKTDET